MGLNYVAVAYDAGKAIPRFEKASYFNIYYVKAGKYSHGQMLSTLDIPADQLVDQLTAMRIKRVIARDFAPKSMALLRKAGIEFYGFDGGTDAAIAAYTRGELSPL